MRVRRPPLIRWALGVLGKGVNPRWRYDFRSNADRIRRSEGREAMAAQDELTAGERRSRFEAELRAALAARGEQPAEWLITEIRSGVWERRQRRNMRNLLLNRAKLAQWKRDGYSFDEKHRLVAPHVSDVKKRRERPRESRPRPSRRSRSSGSSGADPPEPEPPLAGGDTRPAPRRCEVCGEEFTPRRKSTARLCGSGCKQKLYRGRQAQARLDALEERIEPAVLLEWAHDDPLLALDLAIRECELRRGLVAT
jgi:hypothetical protein